jgi:hypothetical protein
MRASLPQKDDVRHWASAAVEVGAGANVRKWWLGDSPLLRSMPVDGRPVGESEGSPVTAIVRDVYCLANTRAPGHTPSKEKGRR